jgi:hypothetical protein
MGGFLNLGYGPLFIFDGLLYLLAHCKGSDTLRLCGFEFGFAKIHLLMWMCAGESYSKEYDTVSSLGVDTAAIKGKVVAAAMGVM